MSTQNDFSRSWKPAVAMSAGYRVNVNPLGLIYLASVGDLGVGIIQEDTTSNASDAWQNPKVRFFGTGTFDGSVTGAPGTAGDIMYAVAGGQFAPASGGTPWSAAGILLQSYTSNGVLMEIAFSPKNRVLG